jgi:uncharacterized membrane protein
MIITIGLILFYFLTPFLLIYLVHISKTLNKLGAVVLAYLLGLIIGNIGLFPRASQAFLALKGTQPALPSDEVTALFAQSKILQSDLVVNQIGSTQDMILSIAIPIALPLLLFSLDIRKWLKYAKGALLSLILGVSSLLIALLVGYWAFHTKIDEAWKVAGMMCGVYTGGTPNLAAIGTALEVKPNNFILTNTYDMVLGSLCLFFFLTLAQRTFNLILPHFHQKHEKTNLKKIVDESEGVDNYLGMLTGKGLISLSKALGLSVLILGLSYAISLLVDKSAQTMVIILSITTLGLAFGTNQSISSIEKTFQLGMYFIIVFSLVIASMADLKSMFQIDYLYLFLYVALAIFGSMIIHVFLSYLFKVDTDTTIITITALAFSPPFVPVVAAALKNKEVIITGITSGIIGYAIGNYLGIGLAYFLRGF